MPSLCGSCYSRRWWWWSERGQNTHISIPLLNELHIGGDRMYGKSFSNSLSTSAQRVFLSSHQHKLISLSLSLSLYISLSRSIHPSLQWLSIPKSLDRVKVRERKYRCNGRLMCVLSDAYVDIVLEVTSENTVSRWREFCGVYVSAQTRAYPT